MLLKAVVFFLFFLGCVELQLNFSSFGLTVVVPWSLPQDLQEDASEPRHTMKKIIREKVGKTPAAFTPSLTSTGWMLRINLQIVSATVYVMLDGLKVR